MSRQHPFVAISEAATADAIGRFLKVGGYEPPAHVVAARVVAYERAHWFRTPEDRRWFDWVFREVWRHQYAARATREHLTEDGG